MSFHEYRADLAEAVFKLSTFIFAKTDLTAQQSQILAMNILTNSEISGVVSAAMAVRLLEEAKGQL